MDEKKKIFEACRAELDAKLGKSEIRHNSFIDAYDYKYGLLDIEIQTDYDNHLAFLIEAHGHLYIYGGDYMPSLADWLRWHNQTLAALNGIFRSKSVQMIEWRRNKKYIGGLLTINNRAGKKIVLPDINNSFLKLFSKKQTTTFKYM